jgi:protocatechuate 3,4-dioxygenase beta subunit
LSAFLPAAMDARLPVEDYVGILTNTVNLAADTASVEVLTQQTLPMNAGDFLTHSRRTFLHSTLTLAATATLHRAANALELLPATNICQLAAEQEQGPFCVSDELLRSNIAEGKAGVALALRVTILDARTCKPLPRAAVDIWHCDAMGLYSGFTRPALNPGGPPPDGRGGPGGTPDNRWGGPPPGMGEPPQNPPSDKLTFLRGMQMTDESGVVQFQTIFPGFYMGRTNHIHFKVRLNGHPAAHTYTAGHTSHTGQIFFPEDVAITLMQQAPYVEHKIHRTTQAEDQVFRGQNGDASIARLTTL